MIKGKKCCENKKAHALSSGPTMVTEIAHVGPAPRIAVEHCGCGPLVLFLHGIGGNRHNWRAQLDALGSSFHAAAWDARGYGASDDYDAELDFADFSRDLVRVLDYFEVERAHLVGLSMGGRIALDFSLRHPERVESLVMASTFAGFSESLTPEKQAEFLRLRLKPLLEEGKEPVDLAPKVIPGLVGPGAAPEVIAAMTASMAALRKASYVKSLRAAARFERSADLHRVKARTLVISGEYDKQPLPSAACAMAEKIPGAEFVLIPEAGHLVNLEQPAAFNQVVLGFLLKRP
jgi:3-oxoadipate enol-lactonase